MINEMLVKISEYCVVTSQEVQSRARYRINRHVIYPVLVTRINGFERNRIVLGQRDVYNEKSRRLRNNRDNVNALGI